MDKITDRKDYSFIILSSLLLLIHQWVVIYSPDLLSSLSENSFYIVFSCLMIVFLLLATVLLSRFRKETLKFRRFSWFSLGWLVLSFLAFLVWNILLSYFFVRTKNGQAMEEISYSLTGFVYILQLIVYPIFIAPICEELLFRGIVMTIFSSFSKYLIDVIASASLFGLAHVLQHGWVPTDFIRYFGIGLILACLFRKTKALQYPILLHMIWNAFVVLLTQMIM